MAANPDILEENEKLRALALAMHKELVLGIIYVDSQGNERFLPWVPEYLRPIEERMKELGLKADYVMERYEQKGR